jgi:rubrerythrin
MEFGTAYSAVGLSKSLSNDDLVRAVRQLVAAEMEAVQMYSQISAATNNAKARAVINSVIEEEKVHVGEFLQLLFQLDPNEKSKYEEGMRESEELMNRLGI